MIATGLTRFSSFIYNTSSNLGLNSASQRTQVDCARKYCETLAHLTTSGRQGAHALGPWWVVLRWQPWQPRLRGRDPVVAQADVRVIVGFVRHVAAPVFVLVYPDRIPAQAHALFVAPPPTVGEN